MSQASVGISKEQVDKVKKMLDEVLGHGCSDSHPDLLDGLLQYIEKGK